MRVDKAYRPMRDTDARPTSQYSEACDNQVQGGSPESLQTRPAGAKGVREREREREPKHESLEKMKSGSLALLLTFAPGL